MQVAFGGAGLLTQVSAPRAGDSLKDVNYSGPSSSFASLCGLACALEASVRVAGGAMTVART
jgi:hypothetical protein